MDDTSPKWLTRATITVDELALVLEISRSTAFEAVRSGRIPSIRISERRIVVPTAPLRRMLGIVGEGESLATAQLETARAS
jgi:excisionase family DNA binding protein